MFISDTLFIDYLTICWHPIDLGDQDMIHAFFKEFPQFADLETSDIRNGKYFYDECMVWNDNIRLWYCFPGSPNYYKMGVLLEIPSHGLEWFYDVNNLDTHDLVSIFNWTYKNDFKISRLDLAYDDYTRTFSPGYYEDFYITHPDYFMTHFFTKGKALSSARLYEDLPEDPEKPATYFKVSGQIYRGETFYLGNRKSGKLLRIYDKYAQTKGDPEFNCIRYEFELHREKCDWLINHILENGGLHFKELICSFFKLLDYDSGIESRGHIPLLDEWECWLNHIAEVEDNHNFSEQLVIPKYDPVHSLDSVFQWAVSCRRVFAGLKLAFGKEFISAMDCDIGEIDPKYIEFKRMRDSLMD